MLTAGKRALAILPAAAALLLSGCADPSSTPGSGPGGGAPGTGAPGTATSSPTGAAPTTPVPTATSTATSRPTRPSGPPGAPTVSGRPVTLDGVVEAGVEPGCSVLTAAGQQYLLLGDEAVPMGVPVRVRGVLAPGVLTTCQQGTPIRVLDVQRR